MILKDNNIQNINLLVSRLIFKYNNKEYENIDTLKNNIKEVLLNLIYIINVTKDSFEYCQNINVEIKETKIKEYQKNKLKFLVSCNAKTCLTIEIVYNEKCAYYDTIPSINSSCAVLLKDATSLNIFNELKEKREKLTNQYYNAYLTSLASENKLKDAISKLVNEIPEEFV